MRCAKTTIELNLMNTGTPFGIYLLSFYCTNMCLSASKPLMHIKSVQLTWTHRIFHNNVFFLSLSRAIHLHLSVYSSWYGWQYTNIYSNCSTRTHNTHISARMHTRTNNSNFFLICTKCPAILLSSHTQTHTPQRNTFIRSPLNATRAIYIIHLPPCGQGRCLVDVFVAP